MWAAKRGWVQPAQRALERALGPFGGGERITGPVATGHLDAQNGPLRKADMTLRAPPGVQPRQVPYGGEGTPSVSLEAQTVIPGNCALWFATEQVRDGSRTTN